MDLKKKDILDFPAFSRRCYGYDRNEEEGLILNIAEARIVLKIFDWYEHGWSIVRIKKELESLKVLPHQPARRNGR